MACDQGHLHKRRVGVKICQKGTKNTILITYPGADFRENHWERCIFEISEFIKKVQIVAA